MKKNDIALDQIKESITLDQIKESIISACTMSCRPDRDKFPYPVVGSVIDEDKSVRWNREEVDRLRQAHDEEVKKLNQLRSKKESDSYDLAIQYIQQETKLNSKQAAMFWNYIFDNHHANIDDLVNKLDELVDLQQRLENAK